MLLLLELTGQRRLDGFDAEWFEAEFLCRLRQRLTDFDWFDPFLLRLALSAVSVRVDRSRRGHGDG